MFYLRTSKYVRYVFKNRRQTWLLPMMGRDGTHPIFETAQLNQIETLSFLNFKSFRTLDVLDALKFKKLKDALLTAVEAVNGAPFNLPLSS